MLEFIPVKRPEHIQTCHKLAKEIWQEYYGPIIGQAQVDYMLANIQSAEAIQSQIEKEGHLYYLISSEGDSIGYFSLLPRQEGVLLSKIYLLSRVRGQGFGKEAFDYIKQQTKELGFRKITLTVNKNNAQAIQFYEKNKFKNLGSVVQDIGGGFVMDDYKFELDI